MDCISIDASLAEVLLLRSLYIAYRTHLKKYLCTYPHSGQLCRLAQAIPQDKYLWVPAMALVFIIYK